MDSLQRHGRHGRAAQAVHELPQVVDTARDRDLLRRLGIDIERLDGLDSHEAGAIPSTTVGDFVRSE